MYYTYPLYPYSFFTYFWRMKKFLKVTGIIICILAFIVMVPPLLLPSSYTASSSIVIESTQYNVFPYFADLRNWEEWSPWKEMDPSTKYKYSENSFGAGSTMEWDSKNEQLGTGKITTVQFKKFHHINYKLEFVKPFRATSGGQFVVEKLNEKQVKVTWTNKGKLKWPFQRWINSFMSFKKMLEKDFAHGLEKLKKTIESSPQRQLPKLNPEKMEMPEINIFSIMYEVVRNSEIGSKIGESYKIILKEIDDIGAKKKLEPPVCLYYSHNRISTKMRPGIIVEGCGFALQGNVQCIPLRAGKVLRFAYYGGYANLEPTYDAIDLYLEENKINKRENYTWESYVSDPGMEPDSTKWLTNIYVPVK